MKHGALARPVVLAAVCVLACGSKTRMYEGPAQPRGNVAVVKGSDPVDGVEIYFVGYDARGNEFTTEAIEITTGHKSLMVHFGLPRGTPARGERQIAFDAIGGHTYQVFGVEWDGRVWVWIEDTWSHETVGGEKP